MKRLNFENWSALDYEGIAKQLCLEKSEVVKVVKKLIGYQVIEFKGDVVQQSFDRYRLNRNFGWKKTFNWVFVDGINWQAFLNSYQKRQRQYELVIQAIENKPGEILVIHLEISALANPIEVKNYLKFRYELELKELRKQHSRQQKNEKIAIERRDNADILKMIELVANTHPNVSDIIENQSSSAIKSKAKPYSVEPKSQHTEKTKDRSSITSKRQQTLAEAVAEREKLLKEQDYIEPIVKPSSRKKTIQERLNKHCR